MVFSKNPIEKLVLIGLFLLVLGPAFPVHAARQRHGALASPPVISPRGGAFLSNVIVTLTSDSKEIRYTTDGTEPGTNSPLYSAPIVLTNSALVRARAFASAARASVMAAEAFTLLETNVAGFNSSLPLVVISTFGKSIPAPTNVLLWMHLFQAPTNQRTFLTNGAEVSVPVALKPRGFSSLRYPKRSYTVETLDAAGEEADVSLLGMPAESDWVLYAPYPDKTLMRDVLAYELNRDLGHYAARTRFVEVFVDDSAARLGRAHYVGLYVLEEKVKISPQRVRMQKMKPSDRSEPRITGGYLFKKDHLEKVMDIPLDGPPRVRPVILPARFPTGPGAFPALAAGFLPPLDPPAFSNALAIVTNTVAITNVVSGTNTILSPPTVTVVKTNTLMVTNVATITNAVIATNQVVTTNHPIATNVAIRNVTLVRTNPVVAAQSVAATNSIATTNHVDAATAVITTTTTVTTSATYRTNFVIATNAFVVTNAVVVTNTVLATNNVVVTNISVANVPVVTTNRFLVTNHFRLGPVELSPQGERLVASGEGFITSHENAFFYVDPKPSKITPEQQEWLSQFLNHFEAVLYGPDFRDPTNGYAAFIDVDSFIDFHLFVEATKNIDGFRFSTYFAKDRGGKLKMEPVWDWNLSFGNARGKQGYMAEHWYWPQLNDQQYSYFRRLFEDPDFGQRYVDRWAQWRTNVFATSNIIARIDALAAVLKEPAARNFERWPILGAPVDPEYFAGRTWEEDIQYMKTWITNRLAWIDAQFVPPPVVSKIPAVPAPTNAITFIAPTGQVYFTVDGTDPRLTNGSVSSAARVYQAPVTVKKPVRIVARARSGNGWSSPVSLHMPE